MIIIVIIIFAMKIAGGDGDNDHVFHVNDILGNVVETFGVTKVMPRIWVKPKKLYYASFENRVKNCSSRLICFIFLKKIQFFAIIRTS